MAKTEPRTTSRLSKKIANRATPQSMPQTMLDPFSLARAHGTLAMDDINQVSTSKRSDTDIIGSDVTHHRARDDMRPTATPDKNRHVYNDADNAAISMGGPTDHDTKYPTYSDANRYGSGSVYNEGATN